MPERSVPRVAVIGAGLTGLSAAGRIQAHGLEVALFDKGRGLGGRCATRRTPSPRGEIPINHIPINHGAARLHLGRPAAAWMPTPNLRAYLHGLAPGVPIHRGCRIAAVQSGMLRGEDGSNHGPFAGVIVTVPAPQAASLVPAEVARALAHIRYAPQWAAFGPLQRPLDTGAEEKLSLPAAPSLESLRLHAGGGASALSTHAWAQAHLEIPPAAALAALLPEVDTALAEQGHARADGWRCHRWRYARVIAGIDAPFLGTLVRGAPPWLYASEACMPQGDVAVAQDAIDSGCAAAAALVAAL